MPDPELLRRLMAEEGVAPAVAPEPSWTEWAVASLGGWLDRLLSGVELKGEWGVWALGLVVVIGVALVLFLAWLVLRAQLGRPRAPRATEEAAAVIDRGVDLSAVQALLAEGRRREAARLAWLWMVAGLGEVGVGEAHADQTHGEFVGTVRRRNPGWPHHGVLVDLGRAADRLCYAPEDPSDESVTAWFARVTTLRERAGGQPGAQPGARP